MHKAIWQVVPHCTTPELYSHVSDWHEHTQIASIVMPLHHVMNRQSEAVLKAVVALDVARRSLLRQPVESL